MERPGNLDIGEIPSEWGTYVLRLETAVDRLAQSACGCLGGSDCDIYFEDRGEDDPRCVRCVAEQKARAMG